MMLKISDDLELPIEAVTQKLAFLGRTGSGKSYGATKLCELMLEAKAQVIALDPVGVWWGLRTGPRKGGGFPILVFGGLHGDVPLDPETGALIANLIVDRNLSAVLDVSQMLVSEQHEFVTDFVSQLFQRKKAAPAAMHIFIEECQEFVPQNVGKDETHMVHAFERLIKLGRNFGIGASLISQRPQEVNKKALNQTECLFAFQMTGPHERKAIESWVSEKGAELDIVEVLPKLKVGEPHVWSPQWLGISKTLRIAKKVTADVSSTPKHGESQAKPQQLTSVDLEELRSQMASVIEKAKAEDPKELQKRITELEKQLGKLQRKDANVPTKPLLDDALLKEIRDAKNDAFEMVSQLRGLASKLDEYREALNKSACILDRVQWNASAAKSNANMQIHLHNPVGPATPILLPKTRAGTVAQRARSSGAGTTGGAGVVSGGMRRMMIALAQRPGLNARQLGVRAGLSSNSGTFSTYLGKLRSQVWIAGTRDRMELTEAGIEALGSYEPLPTGRKLLSYWLGELGNGGASRMLDALASVWPATMTKEELGRSAEISHVSGTFSTYLGKLRTLELVQGSRELKASDELGE